MTDDRGKLLLLGGGHADIPQILAAKKLGFYVVTTGNKPDDLGHKYADEYHCADFSDNQAMLELAETLQVDRVCASCNDFAAISAAYVAEILGFPGHDSLAIARTIHHKDLYRQFALANNVPSPLALGFDDPVAAAASLDDFKFPIIIKPVDLTGGKGVAKVVTKAQAERAIEAAFFLSKANRIVVEEFVEGGRHGISTFIVKGKVVFHFCDNEYYFANPYMVSGASTPGKSGPDVVAKLIRDVEHVAETLQLGDGIVHVQYIEPVNGNPVIIEICRRPPGDLYTRFVQLATGIDYPSYIVRASVGMDCSDLQQHSAVGFFARHCVMSVAPGVVSQVKVSESIGDHIVDSFMWWSEGDIIRDHLTQKLGIVFLQFRSSSEMDVLMPIMQELIRPELR